MNPGVEKVYLPPQTNPEPPPFLFFFTQSHFLPVCVPQPVFCGALPLLETEQHIQRRGVALLERRAAASNNNNNNNRGTINFHNASAIGVNRCHLLTPPPTPPLVQRNSSGQASVMHLPDSFLLTRLFQGHPFRWATPSP